MIGGVTCQMLPHLSGVPHLHVNRPLILISNSPLLWGITANMQFRWKNLPLCFPVHLLDFHLSGISVLVYECTSRQVNFAQPYAISEWARDFTGWCVPVLRNVSDCIDPRAIMAFDRPRSQGSLSCFEKKRDPWWQYPINCAHFPILSAPGS